MFWKEKIKEGEEAAENAEGIWNDIKDFPKNKIFNNIA